MLSRGVPHPRDQREARTNGALKYTQKRPECHETCIVIGHSMKGQDHTPEETSVVRLMELCNMETLLAYIKTLRYFPNGNRTKPSEIG
jgi:hypothetical protein